MPKSLQVKEASVAKYVPVQLPGCKAINSSGRTLCRNMNSKQVYFHQSADLTVDTTTEPTSSKHPYNASVSIPAFKHVNKHASNHKEKNEIDIKVLAKMEIDESTFTVFEVVSYDDVKPSKMDNTGSVDKDLILKQFIESIENAFEDEDDDDKSDVEMKAELVTDWDVKPPKMESTKRSLNKDLLSKEFNESIENTYEDDKADVSIKERFILDCNVKSPKMENTKESLNNNLILKQFIESIENTYEEDDESDDEFITDVKQSKMKSTKGNVYNPLISKQFIDSKDTKHEDEDDKLNPSINGEIITDCDVKPSKIESTEGPVDNNLISNRCIDYIGTTYEDDKLDVGLNEEIITDWDMGQYGIDDLVNPKPQITKLSNIPKLTIKSNKKVYKNVEPKQVKRKSKKPFSVEDFKDKLLKKIEISGIVKDDKGTVIDTDVLFNNLDTISIFTLKNIRRAITARGPLSRQAIEKLSVLYHRILKYDSVFSYKYLTDEAQVRAEFEKRRECPSYTNFDIHCESCLKGFRNQESLVHHNKLQHNKSQPYECKLCLMRLKNSHAMSAHKRSHHFFYCCKLCPYITAHSTPMRWHYQGHLGTTYKCEYCDRTFKHKSGLYTHINRNHPAPYVCELCAFAANNEYGLKLHRSFKHMDEKFVESESNTKCEVCDITFISKDVYWMHAKKLHGVINDSRSNINYPRKREMNTYLCPLCGVKCSNRNSLEDHISKEHPSDDIDCDKTSKKNILCHVCGKGFNCGASGTNRDLLLEHLIKEHPTEDVDCYKNKLKKNILCDVCGKEFNNRFLYMDHMNTHTGARPYQCDMCEKTFQKKVLYSVHVKRHFPPSHACRVCDKKFTSATNRSNHMRIHIGDKRFKCAICSKGFIHRGALNEHVRGVHHHIKRERKKKKASNTLETVE